MGSGCLAKLGLVYKTTRVPYLPMFVNSHVQVDLQVMEIECMPPMSLLTFKCLELS